MLFLGAIGIGFVSAIGGIGGGSLMVPFMVLVLNYDVRVAIATSLLCIVVTSSSAASVYLEKKLVDLKTALILEPTTAVGAIAGAYLTLNLPVEVVKGALGVLLLYISLNMIRKSLSKTTVESGGYGKIAFKRKIAGVLTSFFAGVSSGMFGIGGGVLQVPIMNVVMKIPIKVAVATSSFMVGLTAASGGAVYFIKGLPDPLSVVALASGIVPGATLGAKYLGRLKPRTVKLVFSAILLYASIRMIQSVINWV